MSARLLLYSIPHLGSGNSCASKRTNKWTARVDFNLKSKCCHCCVRNVIVSLETQSHSFSSPFSHASLSLSLVLSVWSTGTGKIVDGIGIHLLSPRLCCDVRKKRKVSINLYNTRTHPSTNVNERWTRTNTLFVIERRRRCWCLCFCFHFSSEHWIYDPVSFSCNTRHRRMKPYTHPQIFVFNWLCASHPRTYEHENVFPLISVWVNWLVCIKCYLSVGVVRVCVLGLTKEIWIGVFERTSFMRVKCIIFTVYGIKKKKNLCFALVTSP